MGQWQTLAELALEHEEELWKEVEEKNKKNPPRISRQVEDHEPLPDITYERTCDHVLNRAQRRDYYKTARYYLQTNKPQTQRTAYSPPRKDTWAE